jgi:hypothetical protein
LRVDSYWIDVNPVIITTVLVNIRITINIKHNPQAIPVEGTFPHIKIRNQRKKQETIAEPIPKYKFFRFIAYSL